MSVFSVLTQDVASKYIFHTTSIKFRANKTLLDTYEHVKFVLIEEIDYSDDLAHLDYSSILFRISGNGDNIGRGLYI
jgi:hypothetical protein